jgi:hypothetical protein
MAKLTDFKSNFNGGTRKNRFMIEGSFPGGSFTKVHISSANIPATSGKAIEYDYMGRKWRYPGEKNIESWSFTVLDDILNDDSNLWKQFQSWQNLINNHATNISSVISTGSTNVPYKAYEIKIHHLDINGNENNPLKTYILEGCWPSSIKPISFNMGVSGQLNSFIVTMVYDSFRVQNITNN